MGKNFGGNLDDNYNLLDESSIESGDDEAGNDLNRGIWCCWCWC